MRENGDALHRIREGAIAAIARHGVRKLSMIDVGAEARVSRGTLYRHFTSRAALLDSIEDHVLESFESAVTRGVASDPDLDRRVNVVIAAILDFGRHPDLARILVSEPTLVRDFMTRNFDKIVTPVARALAPVAGDDHSGLPRLDPWSVAEILVRLCFSYAQVNPSNGLRSAEDLDQVVDRLLGREARALPAGVDARWDEVSELGS